MRSQVDRYVFREYKLYLAVLITVAFLAFIVYIFKFSIVGAALATVLIGFMLFSTIKEIYFSGKELIITNMYDMKFSIRYDEIKRFGEGIGTHILYITATKKKWVPLFFSSWGELRNKMPENLARLEAATGKKSETRYKNNKTDSDAG